jgi:hypothetical protein
MIKKLVTVHLPSCFFFCKAKTRSLRSGLECFQRHRGKTGGIGERLHRFFIQIKSTRKIMMQTDDMIVNLGPLAALVGEWEGDQGVDVAPSKGGAVATKYREKASFVAIGPVNNGPQTLYGLRYATTAWPIGSDEAFHEEVGYWLWDANAGQVMRCFIVPRGVNVLAGGHCAADAKVLSMAADVASAVFGISSNPFLDQAFKTMRYTLEVTMHDDGCFSYAEDTHLKLQQQADIFHHTDANTLHRVPSSL